MKYDYMEALMIDIRNYIHSEVFEEEWTNNRDGLEEMLNDTLWITDSVTGNASGSYWFSRYNAEEALAHNWDLLSEALAEFGCEDVNAFEKGAEWCDVTIRCYLLGQAIAAVLDEMKL